MVTHCICHDVSLERLKRLAADESLDLEALKGRTGCCTGCGLCEPYVRLMMQTGATSFAVLDRTACERVMRSAPSVGAASAPPTSP